MEFITGAAVIIILLLILGIGLDVILFGFFILLAAAAGLSELFFLYFAVRLLFSHRQDAVFARLGRTGKHKYDTAYYITDSGELPNVFPAEMVMKKQLYDSGRTSKVRLDPGGKFVYDGNAFATICAGVPLCTLLCIFLAFGIYFILNYHP